MMVNSQGVGMSVLPRFISHCRQRNVEHSGQTYCIAEHGKAQETRKVGFVASNLAYQGSPDFVSPVMQPNLWAQATTY